MAATHAHTVEAIFARAERVFERRVDTLLQAKRSKAHLAGTPFNARKAKRDARTVAGREKLDALVRRLADLAAVQHALLAPAARVVVSSILDGAAAVVIGVAALDATSSSAPSIQTQPPTPVIDSQTHPSTLPVPTTVPVIPTPSVPSTAPSRQLPDVLDTSSCSDDGAAAALPAPPDCRMFQATQSVVDFVLQCDDDVVATAPTAIRPAATPQPASGTTHRPPVSASPLHPPTTGTKPLVTSASTSTGVTSCTSTSSTSSSLPPSSSASVSVSSPARTPPPGIATPKTAGPLPSLHGRPLSPRTARTRARPRVHAAAHGRGMRGRTNGGYALPSGPGATVRRTGTLVDRGMYSNAPHVFRAQGTVRTGRPMIGGRGSSGRAAPTRTGTMAPL